MANSDRDRWNQKWIEIEGERPSPHRLLAAHTRLLAGGIAIDLACGVGQNSLWLARHGYQVLALDLSEVALRKGWRTAVTQQLASQIIFVQFDLDTWRPAVASCDLIVVFHFLDRRLFPHLRTALRPGGLIFYETRHVGACQQNPSANRHYLLERGELAAYFADWQLLHQLETTTISELIARKGG